MFRIRNTYTNEYCFGSFDSFDYASQFVSEFLHDSNLFEICEEF